MALIALTYCNAATGKTTYVTYDDVAHTVSLDGVGIDCGPGLPSNDVIYTQTDGGSIYKVRVMNSAPYAYVGTEPVVTCSINITSVTVGNASTNYAADGTLLVNATSAFPRSYSKDGVNWQSSNSFTGLLPGTYTMHARALKDGEYCYDSEVATVGFNAVVCELELGNITTTQDTGASDGTISVNTLTNPPLLVVEYRLDAGAWQDSPVFTGLAADTYSVQVRYKNFTSCSDARNVAVTSQDCDLFITSTQIINEQSKYADDGQITINASGTATPFEYSIDDGDTYQDENIFQNLSPGEYVIRVRDDNGCIDTTTVEVRKWRAPYFVVPIVNSHRFVVTSGPMVKTRQNFDNKLFIDMKFPGVNKCEFYQPVELGDAPTIQFRSNYATHLVRVYNSANTLVGTLTALKKTSHLNKEDVLTALFADGGASKTQIFFENGIPPYMEVGQDVTISGEATLNGTYEIEEIRAGTGEAEGYEVLIISKLYTSMTALLTGDVTIIYDIEPYDVYEFIILWGSYAAGIYYVKIDATDDQLESVVAQSEPVLSRAEWLQRVLIKYKNYDNSFQIDYSTGIVHQLRVKAEFKWPLSGSKRTVHEDSRDKLIKLEERVTRNPQLMVFEQAPYMLEKMALAFAHDYFEIDEIEYQSEEDFEQEYFQNDPLGNGKIKLRQVDFIAENSDDTGAPDVDLNVLGTNDTLLGVP